VAVTGLGSEPAAVFFFGTNFLTEDTADTSTGLGIFRGMAAPQYNSPSTLLQNALCLHPGGQASLELNYAILILNASLSGAPLYRATVTIDPDGFTASFDTAAAGGYQVIYAALMDAANVGAYLGTTDQVVPFGFKAGSAVAHGGWQGPVKGSLGITEGFFASAAYPGTSPGDWQAACINQHVIPAAGGQFYQSIETNVPDILFAIGLDFAGPFMLTPPVVAFPTGGGLTDLEFSGSSTTGGMIVAWDDEDSRRGGDSTPDNEDDTVAVTGLPFAPGLLMGYSISNEPSGSGSGFAPGAAGLSVVTPDFQWAALVDGWSSSGAFQSFQRGFVDNVDGSQVHAGTIQLTSDGFVMTTEEDDLAPASWAWHAFGHPTPPRRKQQIYRRVIAG
jgi:hypothetical protein